jgi:hypothetical protein
VGSSDSEKAAEVVPTTTPSKKLEENKTVEYAISDNGGRMQRKNVAQLGSALAACIGANSADRAFLTISVDMLLLKSGEVAEPTKEAANLAIGRLRFLSPDKYTSLVGKNILEVESAFLEGSASRSGVAADNIEDQNYLQALGNVAEIVAWQCDLNSEACKCGTVNEAMTMFSRCLPHLEVNTALQKMASDMSDAEHCGSTNPQLKRTAIASLLRSYAFAVSKK